MTNYEFVMQRLRAMWDRPQMWAGTTEAFGLQLVLLMEFAELDMGSSGSHELMKVVFGPGDTVRSEPLEVPWARDVLTRVAAHLRMH